VSAELIDRIRRVVAATFGVPMASITVESGNHSIMEWDSMNHLHLIVALEAEFGVSFEPEQAVELIDVQAVHQALLGLVAR
jgi:acyl carrier protein